MNVIVYPTGNEKSKEFMDQHEVYMQAHTKTHFEYAKEYLRKNGYVWVGMDKDPSYEKMRSWFHGNAKPYLHGFYNDITGKYDIQATTKSIEKSYGIRI